MLSTAALVVAVALNLLGGPTGCEAARFTLSAVSGSSSSSVSGSVSSSSSYNPPPAAPACSTFAPAQSFQCMIGNQQTLCYKPSSGWNVNQDSYNPYFYGPIAATTHLTAYSMLGFNNQASNGSNVTTGEQLAAAQMYRDIGAALKTPGCYWADDTMAPMMSAKLPASPSTDFVVTAVGGFYPQLLVSYATSLNGAVAGQTHATLDWFMQAAGFAAGASTVATGSFGTSPSVIQVSDPGMLQLGFNAPTNNAQCYVGKLPRYPGNSRGGVASGVTEYVFLQSPGPILPPPQTPNQFDWPLTKLQQQFPGIVMNFNPALCFAANRNTGGENAVASQGTWPVANSSFRNELDGQGGRVYALACAQAQNWALLPTSSSSIQTFVSTNGFGCTPPPTDTVVCAMSVARSAWPSNTMMSPAAAYLTCDTNGPVYYANRSVPVSYPSSCAGANVVTCRNVGLAVAGSGSHMDNGFNTSNYNMCGQFAGGAAYTAASSNIFSGLTCDTTGMTIYCTTSSDKCGPQAPGAYCYQGCTE